MNENYITRIRSKIGSTKIIHPGARIIIENHNREILIIERLDNGLLGLPAGSMEENETIEQCIKREVKEETGIMIKELTVIGISSHPILENVVYPNGDKIQYFTIEFYSTEWEGEISIEDAQEIKSARFVHRSKITKLAGNEFSAIESLNYFKQYGEIMLK